MDGAPPCEHVVVTVCTFRRPAGLARLLAALSAQTLGDLGPCRVDMVIVDNDPQGSARAVVGATRPLGRPGTYLVEPRPGLAAARNTSVRQALDLGATHVAFIDDDEVPEPGWLAGLLLAARRTGAGVVTGPVVPVYDARVPAWVRVGGFHQRPVPRDPDRLTYARTSSALVAAHLLADDPFDARYGLTGGEDTHLFMRLLRDGCRIVWEPTAVVHEAVPHERSHLSWLVAREFRRGSILARARFDVHGPGPRVLRTFAGGALRLAAGLAALLPSVLAAGRPGGARALRLAAYGAGLLVGRFPPLQVAAYGDRHLPVDVAGAP